MSEYDEVVEKRDQARAEYEADPTDENHRRMMALSAEARYRRGPSVEQMIEAIGDVHVHRDDGDGWLAGTLVELADRAIIFAEAGSTPREAITALYRAWRERE